MKKQRDNSLERTNQLIALLKRDLKFLILILQGDVDLHIKSLLVLEDYKEFSETEIREVLGKIVLFDY